MAFWHHGIIASLTQAYELHHEWDANWLGTWD